MKSFINWLNASLWVKTRLISKLNKGHGTLLDVGAGTETLFLLPKKGWRAEGVEVNEAAREMAKGRE